MTVLTAELRKVLAESYHEKNTKTTVNYPYLTYDIDAEPIERNVDGFYLDVDIFDAHSSYSNIFDIEDRLRRVGLRQDDASGRHFLEGQIGALL